MVNTRSTGATVIFSKNSTPTRKLRTPKEWAALGVKVQHDPGEVPRNERETTVAFLEADAKAEICTMLARWQRKLESDGARPESIQTYEKSDADFRWYVVPKSWIRQPVKPRRAKDD